MCKSRTIRRLKTCGISGFPWREGHFAPRRKAAGGSPFGDYQLPEAVLKFKQGFGRLIRSKEDTGMVVVLDSRILRKSYGRIFLRALPECQVIVPGHDD